MLRFCAPRSPSVQIRRTITIAAKYNSQDLNASYIALNLHLRSNEKKNILHAIRQTFTRRRRRRQPTTAILNLHLISFREEARAHC